MSNCHSSYSTDAGYNCHNVGEDIQYLNNYSDNDEYGFGYEAYSGLIQGNQVTNAHKQGMVFKNYEGAENVSVKGNTIIGSGVNGIDSYESNLQINGNTIKNSGAYGIYLEPSPHQANNCSGTGNIMSGNVYGSIFDGGVGNSVS
jgi:hypothetical protein